MKNALRGGNLVGVIGLLLLGLFGLANLMPARVDALFRPYGLFIWLGLLIAAVVLPSIAAAKSSKWWLLGTLLSVVVTIRFVLLLGE